MRRPWRVHARTKPTKEEMPSVRRSRSSGSSGIWIRNDAMGRNGAPRQERKGNRRSAARLAAVQALYQMEIAGTGVNDIIAEFESHWIGREIEGAQYLPAQVAFFRDIVSGVLREQRSLDPL